MTKNEPSRWAGWAVTGTILIVGEVILAIALVSCFAPSFAASRSGQPTIFVTGDWESVNSANLGLRFAIAIASVFLIGSSNFFMQLLAAPTREVVDKAHASGRWVEVGAQSVTNLRYGSRMNAIVWFLLAAISVLMPWLVNSVLIVRLYLSDPIKTGMRWPDPHHCQLLVQNSSLGVVALVCVGHLLLCGIALFRCGRTEPLVTIGDAIASFIVRPESTTMGLCSLDRDDFVWSPPARLWNPPSPPKDWKKPSQNYYYSVIPKPLWFWSSVPVALSVAVSACLIGLSGKLAYVNTEDLRARYGQRVAYLPGVVLSVWYLAVNGLCTRMMSEREWAKLGRKYVPLRVSRPRGKQVKALYLQLPNRCFIPVVIAALVMQWSVAAGAYAVEMYDDSDISDYHVSVVRSSVNLLIPGLLVGIVAPICLFYLAGSDAHPNIVLAGNSSAVISAACHCIPYIDEHSVRNKSRRLHGFYCNCFQCLNAADEDDAGRIASGENVLQEMVEKPLKWGVVSLLPMRQLRFSSMQLAHLAFGTQEHDVQEPETGELYA